MQFLILVSLWGLMVSGSDSQQSSPHTSSSSTGNIVIFSATGRVGSTNLLSMFRGRLKNIGEIFLSFPSKNLPPDPSSPINHPSDENHRHRIDDHIRRAFVVDPKIAKLTGRTFHLVASIKFWHAWSNGVTVNWLAKSLLANGAVTHFILISRNPTRITVSEQYGHRHHSWSYPLGTPSSGGVRSSSPVCDRSYLSYHIGGRWMSQMAVKHYNSFLEILSLLPPQAFNSSFPSLFYPTSSSSPSSSSLSILGLSYEADILKDPLRAYRQIISFLTLSDSSSSQHIPSSKYGKGMSCALSSMLINYEELLCTFLRYDLHHTTAEPISWMATDNDEDNDQISFTQMMKAWRGLSESVSFQQGEGYLSECNTEEILNSLPALRLRSAALKSHTLRMMATSSRQYGVCAVGGHQLPYCPPEGLEAIPSDRVNDFCAFSLARSKCDWATVQKGRCYLHSNRTETTQGSVSGLLRFEPCDANSFTVDRKSSGTLLRIQN
jgi:hypothetical protein